MLIIITAPSGAGKTSITRYLLQHFPQLAFSVSAATRPQRQDEVNGVDYYFMTLEEFQYKIQNQEFVEWEMVYEGRYYGTLKSELQRLRTNQKIPILDIDVKGAIHVQELYPEQSLSIFVQPPSIEELKRRLLFRATESAEVLQDRLNKAAYEISFRHHFNKIIINDNLQKACEESREVISDWLQRQGFRP
jgi:guanylate kinase